MSIIPYINNTHLLQMPYKKDGIGKSPYYIQSQKTVNLLKNECDIVHSRMKDLDIPVYRKQSDIGCELIFMDLHDTTVNSLVKNIYRRPSN